MPDQATQPEPSPFGPFTRYVTSHGPLPPSSSTTTSSSSSTTTSSPTSKTSPPEPPVIVHQTLIHPSPIRTPQTPSAPHAWVGKIWSHSHPARNTYDLGPDQAGRMGDRLVRKGGGNFQVTDLAPGEEVGLHRTCSVDYNVITHGSVFLITPLAAASAPTTTSSSPSLSSPSTSTSLEETLITVGQVVIQRGTLHGWRAGPEGVRWVCVLVDAAEGVRDEEGRELGEVDF